jgi:hypothetical protein
MTCARRVEDPKSKVQSEKCQKSGTWKDACHLKSARLSEAARTEE